MEKDEENFEKDEYDLEKDNLSYGHASADYLFRKYGPSGKPPASKPKKSKEEKEVEKKNKLEKMALFVKNSDQMNLNPDRPFDNRYDKSRLIKQYKGYSTDYLSDFQLGSLFKKVYYSAKKKLTEGL
jgi:hypothetical protein